MIELGDIYEGQGANTAQKATGVKTEAKDAPSTNPSGLAGAAMQGNVVGAWLLVAAVLIGFTLILQRFSPEQTFSHVKLGFYNLITITIMAVLGISIGKVIFMKFKIPGVSALFAVV